MGRKGRLFSNVLKYASALAYLSSIYSCSSEQEQARITVSFSSTSPQVRSESPDEEKITDISLIIFDASGNAEDCIYLERGLTTASTTLVMEKEYTFCACANFGRQIYADHIDELQEVVFHIAYPDEYREGIPMAAVKEVLVREDCCIEIPLERLMARIDLCIDRSHLNNDVEMYVRSARIGNCPRYVTPFRKSRIIDEDGAFPTGFILNDIQTSDLNKGIGNGRSKEVSLYMFENMQGKTDSYIRSDSEKIFDDYDPRIYTCSYIEMEIEYISQEKRSGEKPLIYRFYLGEDRNSFDVRRNTCYNITVTPENDGLSEDSWRVDQSGIEDIGSPFLYSYPSDYIRGDIGDTIHIGCRFSPAHAPFDVGMSYMEDDRKEGIYDYVIDEDGHGATLPLTGPGRGLIYMEAGAPVNDAALFIIEVNQP